MVFEGKSNGHVPEENRAIFILAVGRRNRPIVFGRESSPEVTVVRGHGLGHGRLSACRSDADGVS